MGVYLPKPRTEKESEYGGESNHSKTSYGLTAMQGWRQNMEDAHLANPEFRFDELPDMGVFAVFDGHGGPAVSAWVAKVFDSMLRREMGIVKESLKTNQISPRAEGFDDVSVILCESLQRTFLKLDETMKTEASREELRFLHEEAEKKKKEIQEDDSEAGSERPPESLLEAIVGKMGGRPLMRVVEQDGQKYFQLIRQDMVDDDDEEEDDDSDERSKQHGASRFEDLGEVTERVDDVGKTTTEDKTNKEPKSSDESLDDEGDDSTNVSIYRVITEDKKPLDFVGSQKCADGPANSKLEDKEIIDEVMEESRIDGKNNEDPTDLMDAFAMDRDGKQFQQPYQPECCGSTAVVVMVVGGANPLLVTANAGDSRAVLSRGGVAIALSKDHKPGLKSETERITEAGGKVINGRVDGNLNLSRSIGDLFYKRDSTLSPEAQKITAAPDVRVIQLVPEDEFVIVACDGIWDCLSNQKAVDVLRERLLALAPTSEGRKGGFPVVSPADLSKICEEVCDTYVSKNPLESEGGIGCDNMTIMIVQLKPLLLAEAKSTLPLTQAASPDAVRFYGVEPDFSELPPQTGSSFA